jgi:hypothetical protein
MRSTAVGSRRSFATKSDVGEQSTELRTLLRTMAAERENMKTGSRKYLRSWGRGSGKSKGS